MNKYLILFCSLLFCMTACKKDDKNLRKIEGIVTDFYSGKPVSGATVFVDNGGFSRSTISGPDGYYRLDYDTEFCDAEGSWVMYAYGVREEELIKETHGYFCYQEDKVFDITVTTYGYVKTHAVNLPPSNDYDRFRCTFCHGGSSAEAFFGAEVDTTVVKKVVANFKYPRYSRLNNDYVSLDSFVVVTGDTLEFEYFY